MSPPLKFTRTLSITCRMAKYGPVLIFSSEEISSFSVQIYSTYYQLVDKNFEF